MISPEQADIVSAKMGNVASWIEDTAGNWEP